MGFSGGNKLSFEASPGDSSDSSDTALLEAYQQTAPSKPRSLKAILALRLIFGTVALLCVLLIVYTAVTVYSIASHTAVDYGDCGTNDSIEEARAKGCVFDPAGWVWVRPECYDADMISEFLNRTEYSFHTEPKLTPESLVPMDVVFRGDHPKLFTQKKYHYTHCTYMMKKMHKAILQHTPIDSYLMEWSHTDHCEMVLLNDYLHEDAQCTPEMVCPTWVRATWTGCKRY